MLHRLAARYAVTFSPTSNGHKSIVVNGDVWGYAIRRSTGTHGSVYHFRMLGAGNVTRPVKKGQREVAPVTVLSDSLHRATLTVGEPARPLDERLRDMVLELISTGEIMSPDDAAAANAARVAEQKERARARAADDEKELRARATDVILSVKGVISILEPDQVDALKTAIVRGMKWSRSRP